MSYVALVWPPANSWLCDPNPAQPAPPNAKGAHPRCRNNMHLCRRLIYVLPFVMSYIAISKSPRLNTHITSVEHSFCALRPSQIVLIVWVLEIKNNLGSKGNGDRVM